MKGIVDDVMGLDVTFKDGTERTKYVATIGGVKYDFWSHAIMEKILQEVEFEVTPSGNPKYNAKGVLTESVQSSDKMTPIGEVKKSWGKSQEETDQIRRMNNTLKLSMLLSYNKVRYDKAEMFLALIDDYHRTGKWDNASWDIVKGI